MATIKVIIGNIHAHLYWRWFFLLDQSQASGPTGRHVYPTLSFSLHWVMPSQFFMVQTCSNNHSAFTPFRHTQHTTVLCPQTASSGLVVPLQWLSQPTGWAPSASLWVHCCVQCHRALNLKSFIPVSCHSCLYYTPPSFFLVLPPVATHKTLAAITCRCCQDGAPRSKVWGGAVRRGCLYRGHGVLCVLNQS